MKALLLAASLVLAPCATAQITFTTIGNITFGSDGSTATTIGGTTLTTGTVLLQSIPTQGETTPLSAQAVGGVTFVTDSQGKTTTFQTIGDVTFGSDGSTVQKIGDSYFITKGNQDED